MARLVNGQAVRAIRTLAGLSQPELARRIGITQGGLSHIERGQRQASATIQRALADHLGVSLDAITTVIPEPEPVAS